MKKVITYGTFDLFHEGHYRLLERAKALGDYLIVGVTTDNYDQSRGKLNVQEGLLKRIENVKNCGFVDEIIIEEYEGQKINDILKYKVDIFAIGSDWIGKFDYIKEFCDVIYLERTKGVSSTMLRANTIGIIKLGIVGYGRIAKRFVKESKYVSGVNIEGVYGLNSDSVEKFAVENELSFYETDLEKFYAKVDAVYIASPHLTHYDYIISALTNKKHVLCEKPMVLSKEKAQTAYELAEKNGVILMEAVKTAYCPGFVRLISVAKSGLIGSIKNVEATFTKLVAGDLRELKKESAGGSVTELATYPLLAIVKLLGTEVLDQRFYTYRDENGVDLFTKIDLRYKDAIASAKVGLGVKSEGDLIISGTKGYIYVPAPWWKTEYFEIRFEDMSKNKKYFYKFEDDGLRYELAEFALAINSKTANSYKYTNAESGFICGIIEDYLAGRDIVEI